MQIVFLSFFVISLNFFLPSVISEEVNLRSKGAIILLLFVLFYIGTRPINSALFGDMGVYASIFKKVQAGQNLIIKKDFVFNLFLLGFSTCNPAQKCG